MIRIFAVNLLFFLFSFTVLAAPHEISMNYKKILEKVDKLTGEQKNQAALEYVNAEAATIKDPIEQAKIIVKMLQLEMSLHGYETAVKNMKAKPWPKDDKAQVLLSVYYASALQHYASSYSWEINQREKTDSKNAKDLNTWTTREIYLEAYQSFDHAWKQRDKLNDLNKNEFSDFISPNTYPVDIKDTLRDSLSYLFVNFLNDSAGWSPEESNGLDLLDLQNLASGKIGTVDVSSEKIHPLKKIAYILEDLRLWDEKKNNIQGVLESKLELYRILYSRFSGQEDRAYIKSELTHLLSDSTKNPWYSMAAATLAGFWQEDSAPDALVVAKSFAQKGAMLFPKSLGASRCRDIIISIEAPTLQLSSMKVDATGKRSLGLHYKNTKKVYFRAYYYDIKDFMIHAKDYNMLPDYNEYKNLLGKKAQQDWSTSLEETTDYREHWHYVTPPNLKPGFYIIVASLRPDFQKDENLLSGTMMTFGSLIFSIKQNYEKGILEVETINGNDGSFIPGVKVEFYRRDYNKKNSYVSSKKSDSRGRLEFGRGLIEKLFNNNDSYFMVADYKGNIAFNDFNFYGRSQPDSEQVRTLIYSDRAIYRPLQKIQWKTISYLAEKTVGKFHVVPKSEINVILKDYNGQEVQSVKVQTDEFGAAWGEFNIPSGKALGSWSIQAGFDNRSIRVEEYKRPTFELSWASQKAPIRFNHPAVVIGEAKYYFGQPLNKGKVKYKVQKTLTFPWWCFWGYWDFSSFQRPQIIKSGETNVQADGSFKIEFTPSEDKRSKNKIEGLKYNYSIMADVTDEGGETKSTQNSITVAVVSVVAHLNDIKMTLENKPTDVSLTRQLIAGGAAPGKGQWQLYSLTEPKTTLMPSEMKAPSYLKSLSTLGLRLPGDEQQSRWQPSYNWQAIVRDWKEKEKIKAGLIDTDKAGSAKLKLPGLKAGAYRLKYDSKDSFGEKVETQIEFFVVNETYRPALPFLFFIDNSLAQVGDSINLWMPTGLTNQTYVFEVFQDSKLIERRYLTSDKNSSLIHWPIKEAHRGGLGFAVRLLNDFQNLQFENSIFVPWDNKEISIETKTFRERLIPGQKEKWTFVLKGPKNSKLKTASAQMLAYMYDRSLDALAGHSSPSILGIYPYRSGVAQSDYQLGQGRQAYFDYRLNQHWVYSSPSSDQLVFYANYGIGGPGSRSGSNLFLPSEEMMDSAMPLSKSQNVAPAPVTLGNVKSDFGGVKKEAKPAGSLVADKEGAEAPAAPEVAEAKTLRSNFSETAFFFPDLKNSENGEVELSFEIPDSVTSWTLWLQAFTKDLMGGTLNKQVQTVKDLMVRPYLPRFLREGDIGKIKVVVNNTSDKTISGHLDIDITDETQKENLATKFGLTESKLKAIPFKIEAQKSFDFEVAMHVPAMVGLINFKAVAQASKLSDGELRALPVLPGRFHLIQSRFVSLNNKERREVTFSDLANGNDPSRINEKMVVQVDAQLFYSVLSALPYLVNEPYECVEQTLNRFLSTGILTSLFNKYPAIDKMAKKMSSRKTRTEAFDQPDPNRKMAMEETPWLMASKGGAEKQDDLVNVLDSSVARQSREASLSKLQKAQTSLGGFPWFSGGPPSPYMTLYLLHGFSKALEFGVDVPKPLIQKAWEYMHRHFLDEVVHRCMALDGCWEEITFLNYVLSNYPDESWGNNIFSKDERKKMLDFSFKHWRKHSPYLKGYLALTLHRDKRDADAKLVWDSVMDSAKYTKDEGTHWAREDRSWLWYNDTVETHAFALRTLLELGSDNVKRDGIVEWLFLNKKLNHWKSTRATAEVIYSLAQYLTKTDQLGKKEAVTIKVGSEKRIDLQFNPEEYTGKKNQIVFEDDKVKPSLMPIVFEKETPGLMFASSTWHFSTMKLPDKAEGDFLNVDRKFFLRQTVGYEVHLKPLLEGNIVQVGDEVEVQISISSKHPVDYVHLRDPRGAGFEPTSVNSGHKWDLGIYWYEEIRDSGTNFFFEHLPQGEYAFKYRIRASMAGEFQVSPATLQPMYAPEFAAYSSGQRITIKGQ